MVFAKELFNYFFILIFFSLKMLPNYEIDKEIRRFHQVGSTEAQNFHHPNTNNNILFVRESTCKGVTGMNLGCWDSLGKKQKNGGLCRPVKQQIVVDQQIQIKITPKNFIIQRIFFRTMNIQRIILIIYCLVSVAPQNLRYDTPTNIFQAIGSFSSQSNNLNNQNYQPLVPASATPISTPPPKPAPEVFNDVRFTHHLPSTFVLGEVFSFSGEVNSTKLSTYMRSQPQGKKTYPLSFVLIDEKTGNQIAFTKQMFAKDTKFTHQCLFNKVGSFYFGVFIGERGSITPRVYKVIDSDQEPEKPISPSIIPPRPQNLALHVNDNDLYISWKNQTPLTRVIISQTFPTSNRKSFIISNDEGYFKVPYAEFANFSKTVTRIQISHAGSSDICASERNSRFSDPVTTEINVTDHLFQEIRYDEVDLDSKIESMVEVNSEVQIQGSSKEKIHQKAIIVDPRNQIKETQLQLNQNSIANRFRFRQRVFDEGAYIIEINHKNGYALVNTPVYAGNSYPFLPDYNDLHDLIKEESPSNSMTLPEMRELMLRLINEKRKEFGVPPVVLDSQLNQLAQSHSQDMGLKNYVGHQNLNGENSGDRAKKRGIYSPVGENIAANEDVAYAQYRLDRSPIHLKNTINSLWTRVGIGIYKKYNGVYYITQEFSTEDLTKIPLTPAKIEEIKTDIVERIQKNSPTKITLDRSFSNSLQTWNNANQYSSGKISEIKNLLTQNNVRGAAKVVTFTTPFVVGFMDLVEGEGYLEYLGLNSVAMSVRVDKGILSVIMILY